MIDECSECNDRFWPGDTRYRLDDMTICRECVTWLEAEDGVAKEEA